MPNLYANLTALDEMECIFEALPVPGRDQLPAQSAIFPRDAAPVIVRDRDGRREIGCMQWGFYLPLTSPKTGKPLAPKAVTNARDDKIADSAFWRDSFRSRRCLVPASSYAVPEGRRPAIWHWLAIRGENDAKRPFAFAGIWQHPRADGAAPATFAIATTRPNALVAAVHDRMPVILRPEDYETWLTGTGTEAARLLCPFEAGEMLVIGKGADLKSQPGAA